jgi:hypothetical protein
MADAIELPKRLRVGPLPGRISNAKTGHVIADAYYGAAPHPSTIAAEIVRRWNAHDALLAVCEAAKEVREAYAAYVDMLLSGANQTEVDVGKRRRSAAHIALNEALAALTQEPTDANT